MLICSMWRFLLAVAANGALRGEYSSFSGLVSEITLGGQTVSVSLDFRTAESMILEQAPPFVSSAFDHSESVSFQSNSVNVTVMESRGVFKGVMATDIVTFADTTHRELTFAHMTSAHYRSVKLRDVAGVLGLGSQSPVFAGRVMSMNESDSGTVVLSDSVAREDTVWTPLVPGEESFTFEGSIQVSNGSLVEESEVTQIVFDPSMEDLLIPSSWRHHFVSQLNTVIATSVVGDRVMLACPNLAGNLPAGFRVSLTLASGSLVQFDSDQLSDSHRVSVFSAGPNWRKCISKFRFHDSDQVVLGRALLRSVTSVELDFVDRRMGFVVPPVARQLGRMNPAVARIPVFSFAGISAGSAETTVRFELASDASRGLVLAASRMQRFNRGWSCFRFVAVTRSGMRGSRSIDGEFARTSLEFSDGSLQIKFEAEHGAFGEAYLFSTEQEVNICWRPLAGPSLAELVLPDPESVPDNSPSHEDCSICLGGHRGVFQRLPVCSHRFHRDCLKPWLETRTLNCPLCRRAIKRRVPD